MARVTQIFRRRGHPSRFEPPDLPLGESELARIWAAGDDDQTATQTKAKAVPSEPPRPTPVPSAEPPPPSAELQAEAGRAEAGEEVDRALEALTERRKELEAEAEERVAQARGEAEAKVAEARREAEESAAAEVERRLEEALEKQRKELEEAAVEGMAAALERQRTMLEAEAEGGIAETRRVAEESVAAGAERSAAAGEVSLGSATFDELRALGLSVTQARRVIRYRDTQGIDSVDHLDEVPGLPKELVVELKQRIKG